MALVEELRKLTKTTKEKSTEGIAQHIRKIVENEGEVSYQIIMLLVKEKMERGYTKNYTLAELQEKLPWKKSSAIEHLQEVMREGILKHEKRRYTLNKENELVKRIWNYYNETGYQEKEKISKVWKQIQRKNQLEEKLAEKIEEKGKYREITKKEDEEFQKEIIKGLTDTHEQREVTEEFLMKNKQKTIGYIKQEE
ncbi:MAG: hypothetical protein ACTSXA_10065 [Candidatus Heimdallarchaeota archaeon]